MVHVRIRAHCTCEPTAGEALRLSVPEYICGPAAGEAPRLIQLLESTRVPAAGEALRISKLESTCGPAAGESLALGD